MREEIIAGLKAGRTLCLLNIRTNQEAREIISDLESEGLVDVRFEDLPEQQFSQYKVKWKNIQSKTINQ